MRNYERQYTELMQVANYMSTKNRHLYKGFPIQLAHWSTTWNLRVSIVLKYYQQIELPHSPEEIVAVKNVLARAEILLAFCPLGIQQKNSILKTIQPQKCGLPGGEGNGAVRLDS